MRDLIHKLLRPLGAALLLTATFFLVSCANTSDRQAENQQKLVKDPDKAKHEGELPWNRQESWETQGSNLSGITDRR